MTPAAFTSVWMLSPYSIHLTLVYFRLHATSTAARSHLNNIHHLLVAQAALRLIMLRLPPERELAHFQAAFHCKCAIPPSTYTYESRQASAFYRDVQAIIVEDEGGVYASKL